MAHCIPCSMKIANQLILMARACKPRRGKREEGKRYTSCRAACKSRVGLSSDPGFVPIESKRSQQGRACPRGLLQEDRV